MKELTDTLESIRDGARPSNENEAFSWVETAKHLANTALIIHYKNQEKECMFCDKSVFIRRMWKIIIKCLPIFIVEVIAPYISTKDNIGNNKYWRLYDSKNGAGLLIRIKHEIPE